MEAHWGFKYETKLYDYNLEFNYLSTDFAFQSRALYKTSTGCRDFRPVPSLIW